MGTDEELARQLADTLDRTNTTLSKFAEKLEHIPVSANINTFNGSEKSFTYAAAFSALFVGITTFLVVIVSVVVAGFVLTDARNNLAIFEANQNAIIKQLVKLEKASGRVAPDDSRGIASRPDPETNR